MKRILFPLFMITMILMSVYDSAHGQASFTRDAAVSYSDRYSGMLVSFVGTTDSVSADTSSTFTFAEYQGESWYVNPIQYTKKLNAPYGKPYAKIIFQGLLDSSNWTNIDTLGTADSLETVQRSTIDFNNWKCRSYRMILTPVANGATTPSNDFEFSLYLFLPRKDN